MLQRTVAVPVWLDPAVVRDGPAWLEPRALAFPDTAARVDNPGTLGSLVHQDFPVTLERSLAQVVNPATRASPEHSQAPPVVRDTRAFQELLDSQVTQDHRDIVLLRANPASLGVLDHRVTLASVFLVTPDLAHLVSREDQAGREFQVNQDRVIPERQANQVDQVTQELAPKANKVSRGSPGIPANQVTLVRQGILEHSLVSRVNLVSRAFLDSQDIQVKAVTLGLEHLDSLALASLETLDTLVKAVTPPYLVFLELQGSPVSLE